MYYELYLEIKNEVNLFFKDLNKLITNENMISQVIILLIST